MSLHLNRHVDDAPDDRHNVLGTLRKPEFLAVYRHDGVFLRLIPNRSVPGGTTKLEILELDSFELDGDRSVGH